MTNQALAGQKRRRTSFILLAEEGSHAYTCCRVYLSAC